MIKVSKTKAIQVINKKLRQM